MRQCRGFSLVELVIVLAVILLLSAISIPSLSAARERARLVGCAAMMHTVHGALMSYAAMHNRYLPPFAFSGSDANLPLSGHYGGGMRDLDASSFSNRFMEYTNLWALVAESLIGPDSLICLAAAGPLTSGEASYFPYTSRFSTYCLRFPNSEDLFNLSPGLPYRDRGRTLLGVYLTWPGGQEALVGGSCQTVPLVRTDRNYRITPDVAYGDGDYDVAEDVMMADTFWYQDYSVDGAGDGSSRYSVRIGWCHGRRFNVCSGGGSVQTVRDDDNATVRTNTVPPGGQLTNRGAHYAWYAERIWSYFDSARR